MLFRQQQRFDPTKKSKRSGARCSFFASPQRNGHTSPAKSRSGDPRPQEGDMFSKNQMAAFAGGAALAWLSGLPLAYADPQAPNKDAHFRPDAKQTIVIAQKDSDH